MSSPRSCSAAPQYTKDLDRMGEAIEASDAAVQLDTVFQPDASY